MTSNPDPDTSCHEFDATSMISIMLQDVFDRFGRLAQRARRLEAGEILFRSGDPVRSLFLVKSGHLELVRTLPQGTSLVLQRTGPTGIFAEASLFSDRYHCDAIARDAALLDVVPRRRLEAALAEDQTLARSWAVYLARAVQEARTRAEILALKTVSERLDAWSALHNGVLPAKGAWRHLASEIGVSPEALYREMAARR